MIDGDTAARCDAWLSTWTGNRMDRLLAWYTDDCAYADPSCPAGVVGKAALKAHLGGLLSRFPAWQYRIRLLWQVERSTEVFWQLHFPSRIGMDRSGSSHLLWRDGLILQQTSSFDLRGLELDGVLGAGAGMHPARRPGQPVDASPPTGGDGR